MPRASRRARTHASVVQVYATALGGAPRRAPSGGHASVLQVHATALRSVPRSLARRASRLALAEAVTQAWRWRSADRDRRRSAPRPSAKPRGGRRRARQRGAGLRDRARARHAVPDHRHAALADVAECRAAPWRQQQRAHAGRVGNRRSRCSSPVGRRGAQRCTLPTCCTGDGSASTRPSAAACRPAGPTLGTSRRGVVEYRCGGRRDALVRAAGPEPALVSVCQSLARMMRARAHRLPRASPCCCRCWCRGRRRPSAARARRLGAGPSRPDYGDARPIACSTQATACACRRERDPRSRAASRWRHDFGRERGYTRRLVLRPARQTRAGRPAALSRHKGQREQEQQRATPPRRCPSSSTASSASSALVSRELCCACCCRAVRARD